MTYRSSAKKETAPVYAMPTWEEPAVEPFASPLEHLETLIQRIGDLVTAHAARMPEERRFRDGDRMDYLIEASSFASGKCPKLTMALWLIAKSKLRWIRAREAITTIDLPSLRLAKSFQLSQTEQDVLMPVAAPKVDPRFAQHFEQIERDFVTPDIRTA